MLDLSFLPTLAKQAGTLMLERQSNLKVTVQKHALDIATNADLEIEDFLVSEIKRYFPKHNFLTEEKNSLEQGSEYTWVIDPIDGTKNYFRGIPNFCTSIALKKGPEYIAGVVYQPISKELFFGIQGQGATLNGKPLKITNAKLKEAYLYVELPTLTLPKEKYEFLCEKLFELGLCTYRFRNLGTGAMGVSYVASGSFDACIDLSTGTKEWDYAAGAFFIRETGGEFLILENGVKIGGGKKIVEEIRKIVDSKNDL